MRIVRPPARAYLRRRLTFVVALLSSLLVGLAVWQGGGLASAVTVEAASIQTPTVVVAGNQPVATGEMLRAGYGGCLPSCGVISYQWLRDGSPIAAAANSDYILVAADVGHAISVRVTNTVAGYDPGSADSVAVTPAKGTFYMADLVFYSAAPGDCTAQSCPQVTSRKVGQQVGGQLGTRGGSYDNQTPAALTWQWYRDGSLIAGAVKQTYQLLGADFGHVVTVQVTSHADGYNEASLTSPSLTVEPGDLSIDQVTLPDTVRYLEGFQTSYQPRYIDTGETPTATFQWYRDGVAIPGATTQNRSVASEDIGHQLTLAVTLTMPGYTTASGTSNPMTVAEAGDQNLYLRDVKIADTAAPGDTIDKIGLSSRLPDNATLSYQWYRDGKPITGATDKTYTFVQADLGHTVKVTVTAHIPGLDDIAATSNDCVVGGELSIADFRIELASGVSGAPRTGVTVAAAFSYAPAEGLQFDYQWFRNGAAIDGATAQSYQLKPDDVGQSITVRSVLSAPGYDDKAATSPAVVPVKGDISLGAPVLLAPINVGTNATAGSPAAEWYGAETPQPTYTWQWYRDGAAIGGATDRTYTAVEADRGHTLSVAATAHLAGYNDATQRSAGVTVTSWSADLTMATIPGTSDVDMTAVVSGLPAGATVAYQWLKNGAEIPGGTAATQRLSNDGAHPQYSVRVTVTTADGASASQSLTVSPYGSPTLGELISRIVDMLRRIIDMLSHLFG
ncbi:MAG: hypothetical protein LBI84_00015 [Propionibacteriaceae bacterium]|jgi:hypothetical protein|nr:hypothetical protein [Propionibacteriaceae bacterium]